MKISFDPGLGSERRAAIRRSVAALLPGCRLRPRGRDLAVTAARPERLADLVPAVENIPGVRTVSLSDQELCPLACARSRKLFSSPLDFTGGPVLIAGPCAVEDEDSYLRSARALAAAGAHALRASIFKPRSSPYAFQGMGWPGLRIISRARKLTGLPLVTEATDPRQAVRLASACDVLQVGARNMRNYELLKELARTGRAVLLKRAARATLREWLLSAEYLLANGARKIILCERGDAGAGPLLDLKLMAAAKKITGLPVIADPSHAAGYRRLAERLATRALARGADGLLLEASVQPLAARVDGRQTVTLDSFRAIARAACGPRR